MRVAVVAGTLFAATAAIAAPRPLALNVHDSSGVGLDATRNAFLGSGPKLVRVDVNWFDVEKAQGQYRHVFESMLVRPWWEATIFYERFDGGGGDVAGGRPSLAALALVFLRKRKRKRQ